MSDINKKYELQNGTPEVEIFDISILKEKDSVLLDDDVWYRVEEQWKALKLQWITKAKYSQRKIEDIQNLIKGYRQYVPRIRYMGAVSDVEAYAMDEGTLVYLETVGQESMVKSILSVLMQGRTKMNEHTVDSDALGYFSINKAGNKRKMTNLDNGLAHAILYHSPSISDTDFNILVGNNEEELLLSFEQWLEKSQPLPYPKNLTKEIYKNLQNREKLVELNAFNVKAIKVDLTIFEDDYHDLMEVIIDVCKKNGLISPDAKPLKAPKPQFPLPKSSYLLPRQVQKIYDKLNSMPKTYELDGVDIKPIGLKLFSPNMTIYITEADRGSSEDEYENMHTQCYGYVRNESDLDMSEWGYINIPYYLEMKIPIRGNVGGLNAGFEQDLYFEDMYINSRGKVGKLETFKEVA
jgi:hypothetical protein